jgi:signal transduction histidine kinase
MARLPENPQRSANEEERLGALRRYGVLDTPASRTFDRIAARAARLCSAPIALISFVDENRVWFKSHHGIELSETGREGFFCSHVILSEDIFVVADACADPRFATHPCVLFSPGIRFYAGVPLRTAEGLGLGALSILDTEPRDAPSAEQAAVLRRLAALVMTELELELLARQAAAADRARRQTGRLLASAFEAAPAAMAVMNEDGSLLAVNRRYCALAGCEPQQLIGRMPSFDAPRCGGDGQPVEWRVRRGDGAEAVLLASVAPLDGSGMTSLAALDLAAENERRDAIAWSEKMDALTRLAGKVAHDFNNLLMIIMGFSQLLKNNLDPNDPLGAFADDILKAGDRAALLTGRFLTFSGRRIGRPELLDLNELLESSCAALRELAGGSVEIAFECARGLPQIKADRAHLSKAIAQVVANAAEAMPDGGRIAISVSAMETGAEWLRTHAGMKAGPYAVLTIRDSGPGMDAETRKRLCEPFFTTRPGRDGCGLSAVYGTVKQCGGCVAIASEPGKGTAVTIYLPAAEQAPPAESE